MRLNLLEVDTRMSLAILELKLMIIETKLELNLLDKNTPLSIDTEGG